MILSINRVDLDRIQVATSALDFLETWVLRARLVYVIRDKPETSTHESGSLNQGISEGRRSTIVGSCWGFEHSNVCLAVVNFLDTNHCKGGIQRFDNVFVKVIDIHYFLIRKMYVDPNNKLDSIE